MKSELVKLILSMTSSERREFKVRNNQDTDFVKIFDYINKHQSSDYSELKAYFEKNFPDRKTKFTSGYFSSITKYLLHKILEVLNQSDRKHPYVAFSHHYQNHLTLAIRGLNELARAELAIAEQIAEENSFLEELIIINRQKYLMHSYERYEGILTEDFKKVHKNSLELIHDIEIQHHLGYLTGLNALRYYRQTPEIQSIEDYEGVDKIQTKTNYFWPNQLLLLAKSQQHFMRAEMIEGFLEFEQSIQMWFQNPHIIILLPRLFWVNANFYTVMLMLSPFPDLTVFKMNELKEVVLLHKPNFKDQIDVAKADELLLVIKYWLMRLEGRFDEIINLMSEQTITNYADEHHKIYFIFQVAFSYFKQKMYSEATQLLDSFLNERYDFKTNNVEYTKLVLLQIVAYYQKGDTKYLAHLTRSADYILEKHNLMGEYEKFVISVVKKMQGKRFLGQEIDTLETFKQKLSDIIKLGKVDYLDIEHWLNDLIEELNFYKKNQ